MPNPVFSRFASVPSFVSPEMADQIQEIMREISQHADYSKLCAANEDCPKASNDSWWPQPDHWMSAYRPYIVRDGILQIPVKGILLHDFPYALGSWATGYAYITKAVERGLKDDNVKGIAFLVNSPGGEVAGCMDLADKIFAARDKKPMRSFAAEHAYSAAYPIASAAHKVIITRTGGVGSIGVVTMHVDVTKALENAGVKVTLIYAGKHKVDSYSYKELSEAARERIQARIDKLYDVLVSTVARNRGMDEKAVRKTEALTFSADEAVSNGLADGIGSLEDATAEFAAEVSLETGDETMTDDPAKKGAAATDQAALEAARTQALDQGKKEGATEGATAERTRISAIMSSEEGKKRPVAANQVAMTTSMSLEDATKFLAGLPEEKAEAAPAKSKFETTMETAKHPEVGAPGSESAELDRVDRAFAMIGKPKKVA